jgi:hypothetical protein
MTMSEVIQFFVAVEALSEWSFEDLLFHKYI